MMRRTCRFSPIEAQAASWLVRRDRGLSAEQECEFERWRAADPRHAAAVAEIGAMWGAFDRPAESGRKEAFRNELRALERRARRRWRSTGMAISLAATCIIVSIALQRSADRPVAVNESGKARVTEPHRRTLPDGSRVEFSHGTEILLAFNPDRRLVVLRNGEAHFSVVENPGVPFDVEAGAVRIRAVGTAFAVQYGSSEIEVLVTEGRVSLSTPPVASAAAPDSARTAPLAGREPGIPLVEAGQRAVVPLGARSSAPLVNPISERELNERLSWRWLRLDFSDTSIAEAIGMFRRYTDVPLQAGDKEVAAMRVTGVFRVDNVEGFVRAAEATLGVQVQRRPDGAIMLHASPHFSRSK